MVSYIVIIIRSVSLNIYNKNKKLHEHTQTPEGWELAADADFFEQIDYNELVDAILSLPPIYRDVMYLFYKNELPAKEIAKLLNISTTAVWKRLEYARKKLRDILEEGGVHV
ncbi:MAG: RNA polymerase sigma factor [Porcipelethomonas sp.]